MSWHFRSVRHARSESGAGSVTSMQARNRDVTIEWEERGPADGETILLIMGLGAQMVAWRDGFCDQLAEHGYRVIRFDNRDAGLSSRTVGPAPSFADMAKVGVSAHRPRHSKPKVAYTLSDMAEDAIAVLDAAGVRRAHVVGSSLGGMIAQTVAIEHPSRVASLTSIMSKTGAPFSGLPTPRVLRKVMQPTPTDRAGALAYELERAVVTCGPLLDREAMAAFLEEAYERSPDRGGMAFQLTAIFASGDRTRALRRLEVPTLVIHGRADELVRMSGGTATAAAVPGAELVILNEMGHYLPPELWPTIVDSITGHAHRANQPRVVSC